MRPNFNKVHFKLRQDLQIKMPVVEGSSSPRITEKSPACLKWLSGEILNDLELPEAHKWTTADVSNWLACIGLPQYKSTFKANLINGRTMLLLDASRLCAMNVKDFQHVQKIAREIRKLNKVESISFKKSIALPHRHPETLYKLFRVKTGPIYENCKRTEFFKAINITRDQQPSPLNHFERLHQKLSLIPKF